MKDKFCRKKNRKKSEIYFSVVYTIIHYNIDKNRTQDSGQERGRCLCDRFLKKQEDRRTGCICGMKERGQSECCNVGNDTSN